MYLSVELVMLLYMPMLVEPHMPDPEKKIPPQTTRWRHLNDINGAFHCLCKLLFTLNYKLTIS